MKFLSVLLLAVGSASAHWTCDDCNAVVGAMGQFLLSEESIQNQIDILLVAVCPIRPDVEECLENLPEFWILVANLLWPGYWNPNAEWMCAQDGLCGPPAVRDISCEECQEGLNLGLEQLLSEEAINIIVEQLSGPAFCGADADPEGCAEFMTVLIPTALAAFSENGDPALLPVICNQAIPDTCPAL